MINNDLLEIRSNSIIMESLHDIAMDLPASERSKYSQIVTEAMVTNPDVQLKIITKLAKQVDGLQQIDLEQCNKSMGDITKYQYYDVLVQAMELINESEFTGDIPNVDRMNKIHNILLDCRDDFVWGYKKNEQITIKMYCTLVRILFIMIDLSISDYIKKLDVSFKFNSKVSATPTKVLKITNDADNIIKIFESGNWRILMNSARKSAAKRTAKAIDEMNGIEPPANMANEATFTVPKSVPDAISQFVNLVKNNKLIAIPVTIITILLVYRHVAFFVAKLGAKFANVFRHCAELIKAYGVANHDQSASAVEKQSKVYNSMIGIADRIDAFFTKADVQANAEIAELNRKEMSTAEISTINGVEFGF